MKDMATVARIAEQGRRAAVDKLPILPRRPLPFPIEPEYEAVDAEEAFLLIDAQDARIAELEKERDEARFAPLGDNHHNAAKCPYCRPTFQDGIKRIAELEREIRELKTVRDAATVRICEDGKDSWTFRAQIDQLKLQIRNAYDILHKCGNYRTRKWWSSRSEWMERNAERNNGK